MKPVKLKNPWPIQNPPRLTTSMAALHTSPMPTSYPFSMQLPFR
jgi:hypothetical protein